MHTEIERLSLKWALRPNCPVKHDFLVQLRQRMQRWRSSEYVKRNNLWQAAIDDKIIGGVFARSMGVDTPSILWCSSRGMNALPAKFPASWGRNFVLKPLYGYNDNAVVIVDNGRDRFTGAPIRGKHDVLQLFKHKTFPPKVTTRAYYAETIVRAERGRYLRNETPSDFKFLTFGGDVASVALLEGRKTPESCMAWLDADFVRTDSQGCVCLVPTHCLHTRCG